MESDQVDSLLNRGVILQDAGDADGAYQCYVEAANLGSVDATFNLARMMDEKFGEGSPEATTWWKRAAEGGDAEAMCFYGIALSYSDDFASAEVWLRKSISAGFELAFHNLVIMKILQNEDEEASEVWRMQPASTKVGTAVDVVDAYIETKEPELAERWLEKIRDFGDVAELKSLADKLGATYYVQGKTFEAQSAWAQFRAEGEEAPHLDEATGEMVFPLSAEQSEQISELLRKRDVTSE